MSCNTGKVWENVRDVKKLVEHQKVQMTIMLELLRGNSEQLEKLQAEVGALRKLHESEIAFDDCK